ncbi:hypothetical protein ERO13_D08G205550v2 [Gossypium hirsutum]|uniref:Uncharacterized protein n=1 Tax=Gossypium darwinii TaxID=34276 RepID=A0A5D2BSN9_GOSDA|nr:hypothetical protein ERO13_D08G205550v2 [Gossypium hirsutum]TYG58596.1 hypothetical protein ES288_D08G236200v1 [Gossypium darwinii]
MMMIIIFFFLTEISSVLGLKNTKFTFPSKKQTTANLKIKTTKGKQKKREKYRLIANFVMLFESMR